MTELFNPLKTRYPIWNAGMGGGLSGPELVSSVSNNGGFGVLGAGALPPEVVTSLISETRKLTNRPIGANILLPMSDGKDIGACFDNGIEVMIVFWGDPQPLVSDAHRKGVFVISQCGSAEEASSAASSGVDAVIIQGLEAGGHVKAETSLSVNLKDTLLELKSIPVIAAGGISNGTQIAQYLEWGAKAVSIGTRFVASYEAHALQTYKERILSSGASDTVLTNLYDVGWPDAKHRVIRTKCYDSWESAGRPKPGERDGENDMIGIIRTEATALQIPRYTVYPPLPEFEGDEDELPFYAGTSVDGISRIFSAENIMKNLVEEIKLTINRKK